VTVVTPNGLHANLVSISSIFANYFMGHIPLHIQELPSETITFFYPAIISKVHILHPCDPHFIIPPKLDQIIYFKMGRISTHRDDSNAPKFIIVHPVGPEILRSELWTRKITTCDVL